MSLPVKCQEQSYCNCIRASHMITLLWFCKTMSLRILTLDKQNFDGLLLPLNLSSPLVLKSSGLKPQLHCHDFGHDGATTHPDLSSRDASA